MGLTQMFQIVVKKTFIFFLLLTGSFWNAHADQNSVDLYLSLSKDGETDIMDRLRPFAAIFNHLSEDRLEQRINEAYAKNLYFNDTLVTLRSRDELVEYLKESHERANYVKTTVLNTAASGSDVYVKWLLEMEFEVFGSRRTSRSVGMSHLKFNDEGKITLHQDFWDSGSGLYAHMPVLGGLISWVKERFQPEAAVSPVDASPAKPSNSKRR